MSAVTLGLFSSRPVKTLMGEDSASANEMLEYLLSIPDPLPEEKRGEILTKLHEAPLASLFTLSRRALSPEVRSEAAQTLNARLREGDEPAAENTPASDPFAEAVGRGELPPELATARHFYKFPEAERWLLTTRNGIKVADFGSEADLDHWWRGLKKQRGRILTRVRKGES